MKQFTVQAPGMGSWQPVEAVEMPDGTVQWRGRSFDLANVGDLVDLAVELELDSDVADTLAEIQARTDAADAESARLLAQIEADNLKTQAFAAANEAMGIDAANESIKERLNGDARARDIERFRENYGDAAQQESTRRPGPRTLSSLPALPTTDDNRAESVREQRRRAGF